MRSMLAQHQTFSVGTLYTLLLELCGMFEPVWWNSLNLSVGTWTSLWCLNFELWWECCGWWLLIYICMLVCAVMKELCNIRHWTWLPRSSCIRKQGLWRCTRCLKQPYKTRHNWNVTKSCMTIKVVTISYISQVSQISICDGSCIRWRVDPPICDSRSRH